MATLEVYEGLIFLNHKMLNDEMAKAMPDIEVVRLRCERIVSNLEKWETIKLDQARKGEL